MKSKILSQLFLFVSLGLIYITMSSDSNGKYNNGTSCGGGGCHGASQNTGTTVELLGLPANYVAGQTYSLTFKVTNVTIANIKAGFNILVDQGTFTAGTGSKTNTSKNQITHNAPGSAASGVTTFAFSWTAPTGNSAVTFVGVGNSVNNNGNADAGDFWNTTTVTVPGTIPASVNDLTVNKIACYPNPATNFIIAEGITSSASNIQLTNLYGQHLSAKCSFDASHCQLDCSRLAPGVYFLSASVNGKIAQTTFVKQ